MTTLSASHTPAVPARAWRGRHLMLAPHRLGFFLAMVVLGASALWWAALLVQRAAGWNALPFALPPTAVHSTVMVFGFMPLFFGGFLFTAGPRWLGVPGPSAAQAAPHLLAQAAGWLMWLAGGSVAPSLAVPGVLAATLGLGGMGFAFLRLLRRSPADDRVHAIAIACGLLVGTACLAGIGFALVPERWDLVRAFVHTGLWGFVIAVYVTVAHRMIPFFTSSALPFVRAWRPFWVLQVLLAVCGAQALWPWWEVAGLAGPAARAVLAVAECAAGGLVLYLAWAWGLAQSVRVRLLGMLHLGFSWLGLGLALSGGSALATLVSGTAVLPLAGLHAITMGCLGSLMLAMVTRVSCGHSGRALVADDLVWSLYWLLQLATVVRIASALQGAATPWALAGAAGLWAAVALAWGLRLGNWYGRPRSDGRPG
jgi:uncharacterized protein involved in response to NO